MRSADGWSSDAGPAWRRESVPSTLAGSGSSRGIFAFAGPAGSAAVASGERQAPALRTSSPPMRLGSNRIRLRSLPTPPSVHRSQTRSSREAHVPAQGPPPLPQARLPPSHVGSRRPGHREVPPPQGPSSSVGLITARCGIDRISEREVFRRFRGSSERSRHGCLQVIRLPRHWRRGRSAGSRLRNPTESGHRSRAEPAPAAVPGSGRAPRPRVAGRRVVPRHRLARRGRCQHGHSAW